MAKTNNKIKWWGVLLISVGSLFALILTVWGAINILKFPIYSEYYSLKQELFKIPDMHNNFVPQGIAYADDYDTYLVTGYMSDDTASKIYVVDSDKNVRTYNLYQGDEIFTKHCGGIAITKNNIYIATGSRVYTIDYNQLIADEDKNIEVGTGVKVNNSASFIFSNDNYIYVGEYCDRAVESYVKDHPYDTPEGNHLSIVTKYSVNDLNTPLQIISIRDYVQGFAVGDDGRIYLSTSHGLTSSIIYCYDETSLTKSEHTLDGADVYYLTNHFKEILGPAMFEDLDYVDGKLICSTESACNKYIFGKFFFGDYAFSLDVTNI